MKQFAFVAENGLIARVVSPGRDEDYIEGEYYDGFLAIEIPITEDSGTFLRTKYLKDGEWKTRESRPSDLYEWNLATESWEINIDLLYEEIRKERDQRLYASDWTQIPDAPLTAEQKAAWATYRQELRDVPANNTNITDLSQVVWPTQP